MDWKILYIMINLHDIYDNDEINNSYYIYWNELKMFAYCILWGMTNMELKNQFYDDSRMFL
jgi:hypothetical protein